jgi:hypothetical protein
VPARANSRAVAIALLLAGVTACYAKVLFGRVTIQWDAVAYYYPYQKHFADSIRAGKLPFWTSTLFSGFPFLADLQVGAWYPLNWPFFLAGVTPRSMVWELWLHACLAAVGAYLLAEALTGRRSAAVLAGMVYSLSGYFTAHGEHVGLFQAASYLPLMLYLLWRAVEGGGRRTAAALVLAGGAMSLAGHFQTALYVFTSLGLWAAALVWGKPRLWKRAVLLLALTAAGSLALAAVQVLPTAELLRHSLRSRLSAKDWTHGIVEWGSAATFVYPNALGVFNDRYTGPADITQHYFYAGVLLLPLAALGLADRAARRPALWLIVPAVLYAIGPTGQLFKVVAELPGFSSVRAPSHAMFVPTLGLALLAAAGVKRWRWRWLAPALCIVFLADLWYWNIERTRLLYAKGTYAEVHGPGVKWFRDMVKPPLPLMQRLAAPGRWTYFQPADAPFDEGVETTFGSNALLLTRYYEYMLALNENRSLMSALGVSVYFDSKEWVPRRNEPVLPRFYFPPRLLFAPEPAQAIKTVDSAAAGVLAGAPRETANGEGTAHIIEHAEDRYVVRVSSPQGGTMRIAIPWFPGWTATIDGRTAPVRVMDHALMAVEAPPGEHELRLRYRSRSFAPGASISLAALLACIWACLAGLRRTA